MDWYIDSDGESDATAAEDTSSLTDSKHSLLISNKRPPRVS